MKKEVKYKPVNICAAIVAAVCIICVSVTATVIARPLYYMDIKNLEIPQTSGYSATVCKENYDVLIDYNLLGGPSELELPSFNMSEQGEIHFAEVREIFMVMQGISIIAVVAAAGILSHIIEASKRHAGKRELIRSRSLWMRYTGVVLIVVTAVIGIAMAIDWQWSFEMMHRIFFDNDYWLFDPVHDPVITILPDEFFMHCGILIVLLSVTQAVLLEFGYRRINR